ncbi:MAG: cupin domain-containing protein [Bacteroidota bacterium]
MLRDFISSLWFLLLVHSCAWAQEDYHLRLQYQFETAPVFPTVESVIYDSVTQAVYTANIDGHFMAKDGKGSIGKLDVDGSNIKPAWISGLNAPTGLCLFAGKLYTTDIDELVEIDLASAKVTNRIPIPGAKALNDVTVSTAGEFYLTDTGGDQLFKVVDGTPSLYLSNIQTPNGIVSVDGVLFVTLWTPRELVVVNTEKKIYPFITDIPESDGLVQLPNGDFLVASWGVGVYHVKRPAFWGSKASEQGAVQPLLDSRSIGVKAPDVCFIPEKNLLLVPTFDGHRIRVFTANYQETAGQPFAIEREALAGLGLRRVTNSVDPERELYQKMLYRGKELGVYVVSSETKTANWEGYAIDEFVQVLDGRARLQPEGQDNHFYYPGDHFLVPQGYRGAWETQGGNGLYYELSVVGFGEETHTAISVEPQCFSRGVVAGNPPVGANSTDTLQGRKLEVFITQDTSALQRLNTEAEQLIRVLTGIIRLQNQSGQVWTFYAGDLFVLPSGFNGVWRRVGERAVRCLRVRRRKG